MAKLTQEMKEMIATQQCFIATVNADGTPNVAPKRSTPGYYLMIRLYLPKEPEELHMLTLNEVQKSLLQSLTAILLMDTGLLGTHICRTTVNFLMQRQQLLPN